MVEQPLQVQGAALRHSGLNLDLFAEQLFTLHGAQRDGMDPATAMPVGALGIVGEPARLRYNLGLHGFNDRLADGSHSAQHLSETLIRSADGYYKAEDANVQALLDLPATDASELDHDLLSEPVSMDGRRNPLFDAQGSNREWELMALLGVATAGGLSALGLRHMLAQKRYIKHPGDRLSEYRPPGSRRSFWTTETEPSRIAIRSGRTAGLLKVAGRMSVAATVGALVWATAVVPSDETLDNHVNYWASMARSLHELFRGGDPAKRDVLARAWSGDAMVAADAKLRAFMTAGIELSDEAVGHAQDLASAVKLLNRLHDHVYGVTLLGVLGLALIRTSYMANPVAALAAQETAGRKISTLIVRMQAMIAVLTSITLFRTMDGQRKEHGPKIVPDQDFPRA
ncbi:hypothetical protein [Nonomuraea cavernae]|uniref:Uncharacterized protein n=1 Tax=Nonomuraea cavernae TaxID=2045107 RepID=A0A917YXN6_9ACTN|nr:hypothetical protein [Nonomuraea cavernae]MCA2185840.1 hypothetical protein [Nonomuraea cavernae]GGO69449.1 hypothetical protein GCM10012289_30620 [Nonomuraea cavernae]